MIASASSTWRNQLPEGGGLGIILLIRCQRVVLSPN
jgi:hypothetical protein